MTKDELRALGEAGARAILERRNEKPSNFEIAFNLAAGALALTESLTVPEMLAEEVFRDALAKHSLSEATFRSAVTEARKQLKAAKREGEAQAAHASLPKVGGRRRVKTRGPSPSQDKGQASEPARSAAGTLFPADGISNHSTESL